MRALTFLDMALVSCVELDRRNFQLTVLERWSERRLLRDATHERVKTYSFNIGVERFMDCDRFVLKPDPRHFRLIEIWSAWISERRLDRYVETDVPVVRYKLPPVPVFVRR